MFNFLNNIGPTEIIVLFAIILLFFGSRIAIGVGKASGQTLKEIKNIVSEITGTAEEVGKKDSHEEVSV